MSKDNSVIKEAIINAIISIIITSFFSLIINYIAIEKMELVISSAKRTDDSYITIVEINNYKENNIIENSNIILNSNAEILSINSTLEANVKDNKIVIEKIYPNSKENLLIETKSRLKQEDLSFQIPVKNKIRWTENEKNIFQELLLNVFITGIVYLIITIINNIVLNKYINEKIKSKNEEVEKANIENQRINLRQNEIEKEVSFIKKKVKLLHRKNLDYAKELDFWKDTIRKTFYTKENIKDSRGLFELVTKNLKTYATLENLEMVELEILLEDEEKKNN